MKFTSTAKKITGAARAARTAAQFVESGSLATSENSTLAAAALEAAPAYKFYASQISEIAELAAELRGDLVAAQEIIPGRYAAAAHLVGRLVDLADLGINSVRVAAAGSVALIFRIAAELAGELAEAELARTSDLEIAELLAATDRAELAAMDEFLELLGRADRAASRIAYYIADDHLGADPDNFGIALRPAAELARGLEKLAAEIGAPDLGEFVAPPRNFGIAELAAEIDAR
tara:strand:- start:17209 stop:17907 length:699 start_codon:yes stop_codon:yes gene_type:complete